MFGVEVRWQLNVFGPISVQNKGQKTVRVIYKLISYSYIEKNNSDYAGYYYYFANFIKNFSQF
jgi:hypothetical protein